MNKMNMPGFTADASLYSVVRHYCTLSVLPTPRGAVEPQLMISTILCTHRCHMDGLLFIQGCDRRDSYEKEHCQYMRNVWTSECYQRCVEEYIKRL